MNGYHPPSRRTVCCRPLHRLMKGYALPAALLLLAAGLAGRAGAAELTMTATAIQSSCTVDVSAPSLTFTVKAAEVVGPDGGGLVSPMQKTTVSLKDCGLGKAETQPVVTLSGNHPGSPEITANSSGIPYVFKDSGSSYRYWFVASKTVQTTYVQAQLLADQNEVISGQKGESGKGLSQDVWLGVTCATSTYCAGARPGDLKATLHFTFKYK